MIRKIDGSPPRAWGRRAWTPRWACRTRFTPTSVETTTGGTTGAIPKTVHPHGRGDDAAQFLCAFGGGGSPPRAWGRRTRTLALLLMSTVHPHGRGDDGRRQRPKGSKQRFTPTGVGTTWRQWRHTPGGGVHPHGRGDDDGKKQNLAFNARHPHGRGDDPAFRQWIE